MAAASPIPPQIQPILHEITGRIDREVQGNQATCAKRALTEIAQQHSPSDRVEGIFAKFLGRIRELQNAPQGARVFLGRMQGDQVARVIKEVMRTTVNFKNPLRCIDFWQSCQNHWGEGGRESATVLNGEIFKQTQQLTQEALQDPSNGHLLHRHGFRRDLHERMMRSVEKVREIVEPSEGGQRRIAATVRVVPRSTIDVLWQKFLHEGVRSIAQILANRKSPGGAPWKASAQEEDACRVSDYSAAIMQPSLAKLDGQGKLEYKEYLTRQALWVPGVQAFRAGANEGYQMRDVFLFDAYVSAAFDLNHPSPEELAILGFSAAEQQTLSQRGLSPRQIQDLETNLNYLNVTKAKIRALFRKAVEVNNLNLVLGAFGCGAFKNDPEVIARLYKEVLSEPEFRERRFDLTFAILPSGEVGRRNFQVFQRAFDPVSAPAATPAAAPGPVLRAAPVVAAPAPAAGRAHTDTCGRRVGRMLANCAVQ